MKKILITGGSGLLGSNVAKFAVSGFDVYATYHKNRISLKDVNCIAIDLSQKENLERISEINPDLIVHCAALTNIDFCEENPQEAYTHNVLSSCNMAELAKKTGAYLIHISTDCVFDGRAGNYKEDDRENPVNIYGKTKLEAEQKVLSISPESCVVRTNIYGWNELNKMSLAEWMIHKFETNSELPGFKDVWFSPIFVNDLIDVLFQLFENKYPGIIHIASREAITKLAFAQTIAEIFDYDPKVIKPVSFRDAGLRAPRGQNMSLNVMKAQDLFKKQLPDIRGGLERMKKVRNQQWVG